VRLPINLPGDQTSVFWQLKVSLASAVNSFEGLTLKPEAVVLERPKSEVWGDYSTNLAMVIFPKLKNLPPPRTSASLFNNPHDFAQALVKLLKKDKKIQKLKVEIKAIKPGFINFIFSPHHWLNELPTVLRKGKAYGRAQSRLSQKIMVEFAHPNTHKLFHIGHLRNLITGEALVRILEAVGFKVIRANYQGDVGLHIAKCLWQMQKMMAEKPQSRLKFKNLDEKINFLGECYAKGNQAYEQDPQAKEAISLINKKIYEQSDSKLNQLWKETREWSLRYFARIYKRLESHFDRFYFESEVFRSGKAIVEQLFSRGQVFQKSKGAIIFPGSKYGLHDRVFITSEGNATYEAKDVGLAKLQFEEYLPDLIIHVVAPEQTGYFAVLFKALAQIFPKMADKEYHLKYGWVRLKEGKMSSRTGQVVLGEWLLDEVKKRILTIMAQTQVQQKDIRPRFTSAKTKLAIAEKVAVGAVKYAFLKQGIAKDFVFDFEESIALEGNSGPYLMYTYARLRSVLAKAQTKIQNLQKLRLHSLKINPEELAVLRTLGRFPELVLTTAQELAPNLLCHYLYELAQKFNLFYNQHRIIESKKEPLAKPVSQFRLVLTAATAQVLQNGLNLLGISTVARM
jgi:arginyl-tRNA synthetase